MLTKRCQYSLQIDTEVKETIQEIYKFDFVKLLFA